MTFRTISAGSSRSRSFYSFIEDFRRDGKSLHERRSARFSNGWARDLDGRWSHAHPEAKFTGDATQVDNIDAGVRDADFYLATGGETVKHAELQSTLKRPPGSREASPSGVSDRPRISPSATGARVICGTLEEPNELTCNNTRASRSLYAIPAARADGCSARQPSLHGDISRFRAMDLCSTHWCMSPPARGPSSGRRFATARLSRQ